jgi:aspartate racemase
MRRIGLVGGLGPESTVDYYHMIINKSRDAKEGRVPEIVVYSLDMKDFPRLEHREKIVRWLAGAINALHRAGAEFAAITANTPHVVFDELEALSPIPLVSIVEETCRVAQNLDLKNVGLLGTEATMSGDFYKRVFSAHDISITALLRRPGRVCWR